jgi:enoyl-CoA hydratase
VAITGGFELALACDVLIASTRARFADTHARVGIMPGWGLSQKLSRLIGPYRAKELSLSGNFIDADTASRWGLVNRVIGPDDLMPAARALARDMAQLDGKTLAGMKHLIDTGYGLGLREALEFETRWSGEHNSRVSKEEVESRRQAVLARGRTQQGGAA